MFLTSRSLRVLFQTLNQAYLCAHSTMKKNKNCIGDRTIPQFCSLTGSCNTFSGFIFLARQNPWHRRGEIQTICSAHSGCVGVCACVCECVCAQVFFVQKIRERLKIKCWNNESITFWQAAEFIQNKWRMTDWAKVSELRLDQRNRRFTLHKSFFTLQWSKDTNLPAIHLF